MNVSIYGQTSPPVEYPIIFGTVFVLTGIAVTPYYAKSLLFVKSDCFVQV